MADPTKTGEKTTLVVTAVPNANEMASVQEYLQGVLPLFKGAGGKLVKRLKVDTVIQRELQRNGARDGLRLGGRDFRDVRVRGLRRPRPGAQPGLRGDEHPADPRDVSPYEEHRQFQRCRPLRT